VHITLETNYVSMDDMENATLLPRKDDTTMIGKKNQSNVSLKNVAYGLGIVTLACSGSFVAGRSAEQYKLSAASSPSQLGVAPRLGGDSKASVTSKHSTAHDESEGDGRSGLGRRRDGRPSCDGGALGCPKTPEPTDEEQLEQLRDSLREMCMKSRVMAPPGYGPEPSDIEQLEELRDLTEEFCIHIDYPSFERIGEVPGHRPTPSIEEGEDDSIETKKKKKKTKKKHDSQ